LTHAFVQPACGRDGAPHFSGIHHMQKISEWVRQLALVLLLMGALGMIISMLLGFADVVGTKFFGWPVPGTLEITESTMVLIVFGALAFTQSQRGHIRVEIFYTNRGPRTKAFMDAVTHLVAIAFFALVAWQGFNEALYSLEIGEATMGTIRFPLFPARLLLVVGCALLLVQLGLDLIQNVRHMISGEASAEQQTQTNFQ
jgi:TRAP-type mannitol/chloroaromatic compound transport system permease small subunit